MLAKSADPDQMPHNVASDLGLHYFASCSTIFQQKYLNLHSQTPLKLKMGVFQYIWQKSSFSIKWVNLVQAWANLRIFLVYFSHWAVEPDNVAGLENCAVVRYNGHFSDRDCNAKQSFVCKKAEDYGKFEYHLIFNMRDNSPLYTG